jgi:hypothetical protein
MTALLAEPIRAAIDNEKYIVKGTSTQNFYNETRAISMNEQKQPKRKKRALRKLFRLFSF